MRLQSEKLLLHGDLPANQQEVIQQQLEGINRLSFVIEKLLLMAIRVGGISSNLKSQNTAKFIQHFREDAQIFARIRASPLKSREMKVCQPCLTLRCFAKSCLIC